MGETTIAIDNVSGRARTDDCGSARASLSRLFLIGWALAVTAVSAAAGTEVQGQADQLELRTTNASTREVLDALARAFGLTYKLPAEVSREHSGRYSGTLYQVLGRILDGTNYVVKPLEDRLEVVVLGKSGTTGMAAPANPVTVTQAAPMQQNSTPTVTLPLSAPQPVPAVPTLSTATPPPLASYLN